MTSGPEPRVRLAPGPEEARIRTLIDAARDAGAAGPADLAVPNGDDAVAFGLGEGEHVVLSSDLSVEGIHFDRGWSTFEVAGRRAVSSGLSDLAAMAARPIGALVSIALPPELGATTLHQLGRGIGQALSGFGGLLGGDLAASPGPVVIDVTSVGACQRPVGRGGLRPGDGIWVTGTLGGAAAAVHAFQSGLEPHPAARRAFEAPTPRIREALWLASRLGLSAAIDVSDGLARDARHLAVASGCTLMLAADRIPVSRALGAFAGSPAAARLAITGGEDYELLFGAPDGSVEPLADEFEATFDLDLTRIGEVRAGEAEVRWTHADPDQLARLTPLLADGYDHFASPAAG